MLSFFVWRKRYVVNCHGLRWGKHPQSQKSSHGIMVGFEIFDLLRVPCKNHFQEQPQVKSPCRRYLANKEEAEEIFSWEEVKSRTKIFEIRMVCLFLTWLILVLATQSIANVVKSSLGPVGLDKMLVDDIGVCYLRYLLILGRDSDERRCNDPFIT
jgi:hypothetical protein